jgi:hypothetical protein
MEERKMQPKMKNPAMILPSAMEAARWVC